MDTASINQKVFLKSQLKLFIKQVNQMTINLMNKANDLQKVLKGEDSIGFKKKIWLKYASRVMRRLVTGVMGWRGAQLYSEIQLIDGPIGVVDALDQIEQNANDQINLWKVEARVSNFHLVTKNGDPIETISDVKQNLYWWWCPNCYATENFMDLFFEFFSLRAKDKTLDHMPCEECSIGKMEPRLALKLELIDKNGTTKPVVIASPLLESLTLMPFNLWQISEEKMLIANTIFGSMFLEMLLESLCPDKSDLNLCPLFTWVLDTSQVNFSTKESIFDLWQVQSFYIDYVQDRSL